MKKSLLCRSCMGGGIVLLWLLLTLQPSGTVMAQGLDASLTAMERARVNMNGFSLAVGLHESRFLNPAFSRRVGERVIRPATGLRVAMEFHRFPFFGAAGYFESNFRIHDHAWGYPDGVNVKHNGFDLTGGMFLMHATTRILPYLAAAVQSGSLLVASSFLQSGDDRPDVPSSSVTTGVMLRAGLQSRLYKGFRVQGEYLRSIGASGRSFYGYWFGVNILIYKR
jgi:hypothetical protein